MYLFLEIYILLFFQLITMYINLCSLLFLLLVFNNNVALL